MDDGADGRKRVTSGWAMTRRGLLRGLVAAPALASLPGCAEDERCGFCNFGCRLGAKQSTTRTWLEDAGAHVIYGVVGYKTHAKMLMIVRREEGKHGSVLRRYVHLGTGNYHPKTARLYSDFGLLTCNEEIGADTNEVFKQLTGRGVPRGAGRVGRGREVRTCVLLADRVCVCGPHRW